MGLVGDLLGVCEMCGDIYKNLLLTQRIWDHISSHYMEISVSVRFLIDVTQILFVTSECDRLLSTLCPTPTPRTVWGILKQALKQGVTTKNL